MRLGHVLVTPTGVGAAAVDVALQKLGKSRRVAVRVPHFLVAPLLVAASDYIITLPERVVWAAAPLQKLVVLKPPVEVPPFSMALHLASAAGRQSGARLAASMVISSSVPSRS